VAAPTEITATSVLDNAVTPSAIQRTKPCPFSRRGARGHSPFIAGKANAGYSLLFARPGPGEHLG
jgi:hypothetical protein